ncbi:unnamed protein product [Rotaria sp. Silwood1]|nr:unnamed protein product [Rotaria sp. Silwood1]
MGIKNHRYNTSIKLDNDERSEGELDSSLTDNTEIIHIDDPIAQQSTNPLTYVFPPGTDINEYFQRKKKTRFKIKT